MDLAPNSLTKIMLIDDEHSVLFALRLLLEALKFDVLPYSSGQEAIESLVQGAKPDYIICDLRMPDLGGIEVLTLAKSHAPSIPRILMSAHATSEEIEAAQSIGLHGFLGKPFTVEELKQVLNES